MPTQLPTGVVTFLFTDIEGSTLLLNAVGPDAYADLLASHRRIIREAIASAGGHELGTEGDSFVIVFGRPEAGLAAAVDAQRGLLTELSTPGQAVFVRMGLHTGEAMAGADEIRRVECPRGGPSCRGCAWRSDPHLR